MDDKQFINQFAIILAILVAITVALIILASYLYSYQEMDVAMVESMEKRLKPVGEVYIGEAPASVAPTPQAPNVMASEPQQMAEAMDAKMIYDTACAACHAAGVLEAPIYGDQAAWAPRLALGTEALYASSINGKGNMPPKGGRADLSDDAIKAAVDYMLEAVQ